MRYSFKGSDFRLKGNCIKVSVWGLLALAENLAQSREQSKVGK